MKRAHRCFRVFLFCLVWIGGILLSAQCVGAELTEEDLKTLIKLGIDETAVLSRIE